MPGDRHEAVRALLPWYVTWALPVLWLLPKVPRFVLLGTSTALAVSQFTALMGRHRLSSPAR